jgi:hypothetical protein
MLDLHLQSSHALQFIYIRAPRHTSSRVLIECKFKNAYVMTWSLWLYVANLH